MTDLSKIRGMRIPDWSKDDLKKKLSKKDLWEFLIGAYGDEIMSRENKFRVWDQNSKKWPKEDYVLFPDGKPAWGYWEYGTFKTDSYYQDENGLVVELFTGLTDKNGKDIYEGDIVKYTAEDGDSFLAPVKYFAADDYPAFDIPNEYIPKAWQFDSNVLNTGVAENTIEVVGNVHEDSNLLEGGK